MMIAYALVIVVALISMRNAQLMISDVTEVLDFLIAIMVCVKANIPLNIN